MTNFHPDPFSHCVFHITDFMIPVCMVFCRSSLVLSLFLKKKNKLVTFLSSIMRIFPESITKSLFKLLLFLLLFPMTSAD